MFNKYPAKKEADFESNSFTNESKILDQPVVLWFVRWAVELGMPMYKQCFSILEY